MTPVLQEKSPKSDPPMIKITKSKETQTDVIQQENLQENETFNNLRAELITATNEIASKEETIQQLKSKITEHEMNISLFRKQLGDKQSQITFYERHILELQSKKEISATEGIDLNTNEEVLALKVHKTEFFFVCQYLQLFLRNNGRSSRNIDSVDLNEVLKCSFFCGGVWNFEAIIRPRIKRKS